MILTITLNPALDKTTNIRKLISEKKMRCSHMQVEAGEGGINVSKVIKELEELLTYFFFPVALIKKYWSNY